MTTGTVLRLAEAAPAKLNLALEMRGLNVDGYHDLRSVMIGIELADSLILETDGPPVETPTIRFAVEGAGSDVPADDSNLVVRAMRAYMAETGGAYPSRLDVRLHKRVPSQAGLGGGSADAAAAVRLLARLRPLPRARALEVCARLGSDIPFMLDGGAAMAEGRGERLRALRAPTPFWTVLVQPAERISTAWCYQAFDRLVGWTPGSVAQAPSPAVDGLSAALEQGDLAGVAAHLYNDLERPVYERYPHLREIPRILRAAGCAGALMTGSGSCFFGLASSRTVARQAARAAAPLGRVWITRTWREAE